MFQLSTFSLVQENHLTEYNKLLGEACSQLISEIEEIVEQAITSENLEQVVQSFDNITTACELKLKRKLKYTVKRLLKTWFISDLKVFRRKHRKAERVYYTKCDSNSWSEYKKQGNLLSRKLQDSK